MITDSVQKIYRKWRKLFRAHTPMGGQKQQMRIEQTKTQKRHLQ